ncbi:arginine--tRNA ligase [Coprococcus sp. OM04-5BH]|uniref:arginine--tRNA ligase n=1 Tax=Coprococcus sp. OM04-5BH TaxID=2293093 RepID=UPI000E4A4005|nr:arginine--tRNA ligase [Coprococcus sp. OM04-5BH]RHV34088.1 arginine--tRNA ligase [Coprococcus sp. OM04-5BH]
MKNKIIDLLAAQIEGMSKEDISATIEIPPKPEMGDFAFPCFRLAKTMHKAPNMIAADIKEAIGDVDYLDRIEVKGAYLNFFVKTEVFVKSMIEAANSENFGGSDIGEGKNICLDYSSPNVAKNFHVGHLRTTIIGNSLYKIFSKLGYNAIRINHLGDWGTQFGKLIVAYKAWGSKEAVEKDGISELMKLYVKFHEEADKNPELVDEARAWFAKMEHGDEEALSIWQWFKDISLVEYKRTYDLLGVDFDYYLGESFYRDKCQEVVDKITEAGLLKESEGAMIVDLSEYDMAPCIITKKDGSSIYATRDLAAIFYRKKTYNFCKCLYVTGQEQKLHFAQVFKVVELLGNEWAKDQLVHIPYGLVSLEGAKLSTRNGNIIYAEDILHDAIEKSLEIITEKSPNLENKEEVAKMVGVGSVLFNDLYNQRIKDVSFSWDKVLNFDGETGPYVQYTHARCSSVVRLAENFDPSNEVDFSVITEPDAIFLLKEINRFPKVVLDAADKYEPSIVARFSVDVAQAFNKFYNSTRINVPEENVKNARVMLTYLTKKTLSDALELLGIQAPEAM